MNTAKHHEMVAVDLDDVAAASKRDVGVARVLNLSPNLISDVEAPEVV